MKEELLQAAWLYRWYHTEDLKNQLGKAFEVLTPGLWNRDAGPDFLDARIKTGSTTWAGPVEIHLRSSDWPRHGHQQDPQYENVILHVVLKRDEEVFTRSGRQVETVEISLQGNVLQHYQRLMQNVLWIPCADRFPAGNPMLLFNLFDRLMVDRLEKRHETILKNLEKTGNDWEFVFWLMVARALGGQLNGLPMELLVQSLAAGKNLLKTTVDRFVLEALFFGMSSLEKPGSMEDAHWNKLLKEYRYLKNKFELPSLDPVLWRFARIRPASFPPVLILRLIDLICSKKLSLQSLLSTWELSDLRSVIMQTPSVTDRLIINALVPLLFSYGKMRSSQEFQDRAFHFLEQIKPEDNRIIRGWKALGLCPENALSTQSLMHLKNKYCNFKQCLRCPVGIHYLAEQS